MYITLMLPLMGSIILGFISIKIGVVSVSQIITYGSIIITTFLSIIIFLKVIIIITKYFLFT